MLELAKMLVLVAPVTMTTEQRETWLRGAADALEDISAGEVRNVSAEVRRSATRINQIVPEIAKLVAEKRARSGRADKPASPFVAERQINAESLARRSKARTQREVEEAWAWERGARIDARLHVTPIEKPLSQSELAALPAHILRFGLNSGFLKHAGNAIVEVNDPEETDRLRKS